MVRKSKLETLKDIVCRVVATGSSPTPTATIKLSKDNAAVLRQNGIEVKAGMPREIVETSFGAFERRPVQPSLTFDNSQTQFGAGDFVRVSFEQLAGRPQGLRITPAVSPGAHMPPREAYMQMATGDMLDHAARLPDSGSPGSSGAGSTKYRYRNGKTGFIPGG